MGGVDCRVGGVVSRCSLRIRPTRWDSGNAVVDHGAGPALSYSFAVAMPADQGPVASKLQRHPAEAYFGQHVLVAFGGRNGACRRTDGFSGRRYVSHEAIPVRQWLVCRGSCRSPALDADQELRASGGQLGQERRGVETSVGQHQHAFRPLRPPPVAELSSVRRPHDVRFERPSQALHLR